jgi:hypothetical protein
MKRLAEWVSLTTTLLLLSLSSAAATAPAGVAKPQTKATSLPISVLAMDGTRVAYGLSARTVLGRCAAVEVWNVATGTVTRVSGKGTCGADNTSTGAGIRELAVAGSRVAWVTNEGGISESTDYLFSASLPRPHERKLASALRTGYVDGALKGTWIGCTVGSGNFLAVNRWVTDEQETVISARLQRIGAGLRTIASGNDTMNAESTDGKLVAVLRANGSVGIYSTAGKLLRVVAPSSAKEIGVRGDYLAVLTKTGTLEVYNSHSGRLLHTWPVAKGASHLDISSGLAAYAARRGRGGFIVLRAVHVLRLATGKDRVVAQTTRPVVGVQLEPVGLAYAVSFPVHGGKLVFTPMSRVR